MLLLFLLKFNKRKVTLIKRAQFNCEPITDILKPQKLIDCNCSDRCLPDFSLFHFPRYHNLRDHRTMTFFLFIIETVILALDTLVN